VGCHVGEVHRWAQQNTQQLEQTAALADSAAEVMSGVAGACGIAAIVTSESIVGGAVFGACAATAGGLAIGSTAAAAAMHGLASWGESDAFKSHDEYEAAVIDAGSIPLSSASSGFLASCAPTENLARLGEMWADSSTGVWSKLMRASAGLQ
jgi:hypothetical protein